ncbi:phosphohistidine phosphatase [Marinomonas ushuaiensis DSM 15871]|uniref:Phosphohistidine phosphatase n=1 Tax=Marinomonas ushuaiensis DSM 15871 TaxID=1122207 RepID=X7E6R9_9GAMM|nr:histidine phosphatase family protein [Marinomonas ushuaiensis]ETX11550.1 phosphohistidine phosphatase [Marinomonas ushuaiensis DSM 15871]
MKKLKRLYVLRHGNAEPYRSGQDELRELTKLGEKEVISTAESFLLKNETFDVVFVSPYVRAQQTVNTFLTNLNASVEVKDCPLITPDGCNSDVALWLSEQPYDSILLVTHQPFAHQFIDYMIDEPLPINFAMTTATLASIEGEVFAGACCQYRWHMSPS